MTSTTSFPKRVREFRQVYIWTLKKNVGMAALLTALLFLFCPLILLIEFPRWMESAVRQNLSMVERIQLLTERYTSIIGDYMSLAFLVILGLAAVILCVTLFGYMQNKRSVDLFHAMPVGRTSMLLGRWSAGLTVLYVPLFLNVAASRIIGAVYGIIASDPKSEPFIQMLWIMLMLAAVFSFTMFMAVCSGTVFDTLISMLGVNVGYPLTILCALTLASMTVPGLAMSPGDHLQLLSAFAPFVAAVLPFMGFRSVGFLIWWLLMTVVLIVGSCLLYNRRKSEAAGDAFAIPVPKIIIRFLMTAVGGMAFGLIMVQDNHISAFFIGVLAGSLIAHMIVEAVYSRGFKRMKQSMGWYAIFAVCFVVYYGILVTGLFGFDTRVPSASEVQDVEIDQSNWPGYYIKTDSGCDTVYDSNGRCLLILKPDLREPENIKTVIDAQRNIIKEYRKTFPYTPSTDSWTQLRLTYTMKDGRTIYRAYRTNGDRSNLESNQPFDEGIKKITALPEFMQTSDMVFYVEPKDVKSVEVRKEDHGDGVTYVPTVELKKELLEAVQKDFLNYKVNRVERNEEIKELAQIKIEYNDVIKPKNEKLQQLLGSYRGTISLRGGGTYTVYDTDSAVYQLLKKQGWIS